MKFPLRLIALALGASLVCGAQAAGPGVSLDPALPDYVKGSGVSGSLSSVGSDTLATLMTLWAEEYKRLYPNVNVQVQAAGSSTAPPALTEGTAQFGPMSREMKDKEAQEFEKRHGYKPTAIRVAIDARSEKVGARIRDAQMQKIPYMLILGPREAEAGVVSVRSRSAGDQGGMKIEALIEKLKAEVASRGLGGGEGK